MRLLKLLILIIFLPSIIIAQQYTYWQQPSKEQADSLKIQLGHVHDDTIRMYLCREIGFYYQEIQRDSSLYYSQQSLFLAKKLNLKLWEAEAQSLVGFSLLNLGDYPASLKALLNAQTIAEDKNSEKNIWNLAFFSKEKDPFIARMTVLGRLHDFLGILYIFTGDMEKRLFNFFYCRKIAESIGDSTLFLLSSLNLGHTYLNLGKLDSALLFEQEALQFSYALNNIYYNGYILNLIGEIYMQKETFISAKEIFEKSIKANKELQNLNFLSVSYVSMANLLLAAGQTDSSLYYSKKGLETIQNISSPNRLLDAYNSLASIYKQKSDMDSAFLYLDLAMAVKDSLYNSEKIKLFQGIGFDEQLRVNELEAEKIQTQNKIRIYSLSIGIVVFMLIAFLLYRNNRNRLKTNTILRRQKNEIEEEKRITEDTLSQLKSTQSQLIQSEKMASLGELTAGIAHEIQNPLNFVNNFSEVNAELITELEEEIKKGNLDDIIAIAKSIKENEEKVKHHGKRAEDIVKGMLQHSRSSSGVKELTDINVLADEYLRLAYHGFRVKDKSFNAEYDLDLDEKLPKIKVIPQDIGRVLLNLINNAFYAVSQKAKENIEGYMPMVEVNTKRYDDRIEIKVKDNGNGIQDKVKDKIFQPFFTTKPTGQGTGLGLSLSYDIIKAHGGEIKVETKSDESSADNSPMETGTQFTIEIRLAT
jgi:signal transduction histidine kinase